MTTTADSFVHYTEPSITPTERAGNVIIGVGYLGADEDLVSLNFAGEPAHVLSATEARTLGEELTNAARVDLLDDEFGMRGFRAFYTVRVTGYPEGSLYRDDEFGREFVEDWRPEGWLSDPDKRAWWIEQHGDDRFFWPKANRLYQTWESAQGRANLLRSYGATAEVVVCEPKWRVAEDPKVTRAKARKHKRIAKLRAQIAEIEARS